MSICFKYNKLFIQIYFNCVNNQKFPFEHQVFSKCLDLTLIYNWPSSPLRAVPRAVFSSSLPWHHCSRTIGRVKKTDQHSYSQWFFKLEFYSLTCLAPGDRSVSPSKNEPKELFITLTATVGLMKSSSEPLLYPCLGFFIVSLNKKGTEATNAKSYFGQKDQTCKMTQLAFSPLPNVPGGCKAE